RMTLTDDPRVLDRASEERTPEESFIASEEAADRAERIRRLWQELDGLGERCRQLLRVLVASPPPSYVEVSAALGIAVGSIGPLRQRCLRRLRARMNARGAA
ncbi:sigma-70 family RNA polymerase sigma factor, partial [Streptomyces sp. NPDC002586]